MSFLRFTRLNNDSLPGYDLLLGCEDKNSHYYGMVSVISFDTILAAIDHEQLSVKDATATTGYLKFIRNFPTNKYVIATNIVDTINRFHIRMLLEKIAHHDYSTIDACCVWLQIYKYLDNPVVDQIRKLICNYITYKVTGSIVSTTLMNMDYRTIIHIFDRLELTRHPAFYDFLNTYVNDYNRHAIGIFLLTKTSAVRMAILDQYFRALYWPTMSIDEVIIASTMKIRDEDDNHLSYNISMSEVGECIIDVVDEISGNIIYLCIY